MNDFHFCNQTMIHFGKGMIKEISNELENYGKNILLVYGGGSIKKNGIYDEIIEILKGCEVVELGGIEPNPKLTSVEKGIELCRKHKIDLIIAVGGGSVIDASKVIAAASKSKADPWNLVVQKIQVPDAIPIFTVLTICATGSEMNPTAVITKEDTHEKLVYFSPYVIPKLSVCDPEYLYTLPAKQTAASTADIMAHTIEQYFQDNDGAYLSDCLCESVLKTCIRYCPIALKEPENYEARSNLMWASTLGLNGILACGKGGGWSSHPIEHELSAYYDITHGVGLAIVLPRWMRYILKDDTVERFYRYGTQVWQIEENENHFAVAEEAIRRTEIFFEECGLPMHLSEIGIGTEKFQVMAEAAVKNGNLLNGCYRPLNAEDVKKIYEACE